MHGAESCQRAVRRCVYTLSCSQSLAFLQPKLKLSPNSIFHTIEINVNNALLAEGWPILHLSTSDQGNRAMNACFIPLRLQAAHIIISQNSFTLLFSVLKRVLQNYAQSHNHGNLHQTLLFQPIPLIIPPELSDLNEKLMT